MPLKPILAIFCAAMMLHADSVGVNGVMVFTDPNVNLLLMPMIAYGHNLWGYADRRAHSAMVPLQLANNPYYATTAHWRVPGAGTIAYNMLGIGPYFGQTAGTTLCGALTTTSTSICVNDVSKIPGAAALPGSCAGGPSDWITLGTNPVEIARVCATTANTGMATLTVTFDGRGISNTTSINNNSLISDGAISHMSGDAVGEYKITGTGTLFSTDANSPICPAGLPGPTGEVTYSTGTVSLTGGSTAVVGHGTTWNTGNGVIAGYNIRVTATHGGGTPFIWWARIVTVGGVTSITGSRPAPADIDAGNFAYKITGTMYASLEFADASSTYPHPGGTYRSLSNVKGCESETAAFSFISYDYNTWPGSFTQSGVKYGYKTMLNAQSALGPNFYGTGLACFQEYLATARTYTDAETCSDQIDNWWIKDPEMSGGWTGAASPLLTGGGAFGGMVKQILDPTSTLVPSDYRGWAEYGAGFATVTNCNANDSRDSGAGLLLLATAGRFDPNSSWQTHWTARLTAALTRDQNCRRNAADGYTGNLVNSFANAANWNADGPAITLDGTNIGTGTGFNASTICHGNFVGTVAVVNGSSTATIVSTSSGSLGNAATDIRIWIDGTGYTGAMQYSVSGATITLAGIWAGQTGIFDAMGETSSGTALMSAMGNGSAYPTTDTLANNLQLTKNYTCKVVDDTHIRFDRAVGVSGSGYHLSSYNVTGTAQQPYMLGGYKTLAMRIASINTNSTIAAGYAAMLPTTGNWLMANASDQFGTGTYYAVGPSIGQPTATPNSSTLFVTIHGWNSATGDVTIGFDGLQPGTASVSDPTAFQYTGRVANAETMPGYVQAYLANPNATTRAAADKKYGEIYGKCSETTGGAYCDSHYINEANQLFDGSLAGPKWPGFFFGIGAMREWPAVRACPVVGGVVDLANCGAPAPTNGSVISGRVTISGSAIIH